MISKSGASSSSTIEPMRHDASSRNAALARCWAESAVRVRSPLSSSKPTSSLRPLRSSALRMRSMLRL
eukprot:1195688-Prorocentrum_minimum.AAC.1